MTQPFDTDSWNTPEEVLERVRKLGPIELDPFSNATSTVGARVSWTKEDNSLTRDWFGLGYANPPYSRGLYLPCCSKIAAEGNRGTEIVFCVPANFQTVAWQKHLWDCHALCFPDHRIAFLRNGVPEKSPPMLTVVGYFGKRPKAFGNAFADFGKVVYPQERALL